MKPKERKYLVFQERGCPLFNISVGSICTHTHLRTPLGTSLPPLCLLGFFFSLCSTFKQQENRKKREREGEKKNADWRVGFRWLAWLVWCCCCHCHATAALLTFMSNHVQCIFSFFFLLGSFTLLNKNDLKALEWLWALSFFPFTTNLLMWMLSASNFWRRNFGKNHVQHLFPSLLRFFFSEGKTERRESNFDGVGGKESRPESKHRLEITFCYRESILLNLSQSLTRYLNPSRHSAFCPIDDLSSP